MSRLRKKSTPVLTIKKGKRWFPAQRDMIHSDDYKRLSSSAKVLLTYICSEYNGSNGTATSPIICIYKNVPLKSETMAKAIKVLDEGKWIELITFKGENKNPNLYIFGEKLLRYYK